MDFYNLRRRAAERLPAAKATRPTWYSIRNAGSDRAVLRIYEEIWDLGVNADQFARDLAAIEAPEIEVQINSPGGDVFDGIAIYNTLRAHPARIVTRIDGVAASIASIIAQAGDHRQILTGGQMMIHEAWGVVIGPAREMREFADLLDRQDDVLASIYASRSGRPSDEFRRLMAVETWFSATEAVAGGLADEIVEPARKKTTARASEFTGANLYAEFVAASHGIR